MVRYQTIALLWRQVIVDYFVGPDGADPTRANDTTMAAMQEAKKKPAKYKLAEVLGNLVLNPDGGNSWNAVRSLRSMAATVVSASMVVDEFFFFTCVCPKTPRLWTAVGGGVLMIMHNGSRVAIGPRIPTLPGRNTSGFHRPGRHCLHQARSAVRCSASRIKGELHPTVR